MPLGGTGKTRSEQGLCPFTPVAAIKGIAFARRRAGVQNPLTSTHDSRSSEGQGAECSFTVGASAVVLAQAGTQDQASAVGRTSPKDSAKWVGATSVLG